MWASLSVAILFACNGELDWEWAVFFGFMTFISAFTGIRGINWYIKRSGKQSTIAFILTGCLIAAIVMLPINAILKADIAKKVVKKTAKEKAAALALCLTNKWG